MNREILFRGKEVSSKKWVYGFYVHVPLGRFGKDEHIIQTISESGRMSTLYDVNSSTVGQFTGVTDKNGKKIFEGDIFNLGDTNILYTVKWHDTGFQGEQMRSSSWAGLSYWKDCLSVIGNIHDNPELIKHHEQTH